MAIYKGTALVSQIIGKLGNNDFMRWRNKNVVRVSPPVVSNPNSEHQEIVRDALGSTSYRWAHLLTQAQKTTWESYAPLSPGYKKTPAGIRQLMKGNDGFFHGLNAAVKVNTQLIAAGLPPVDVAPLAQPVPGMPLITSVEFDGTDLIVYFRIPPFGSVVVGIDPIEFPAAGETRTYHGEEDRDLFPECTDAWHALNAGYYVVVNEFGFIVDIYDDEGNHYDVFGNKIRCWIDSQQELFHKQIFRYAFAGERGLFGATVRNGNGDPLHFKDIKESSVFLQLDSISPAGAVCKAGNTELFLLTELIPGVELRRPSGDGVVTWKQFPAVPATNFDKVDDVIPDDAVTYVEDDWGMAGSDLYTLPATLIPPGSTINWVKVTARVNQVAPGEIKLGFHDGVGSWFLWGFVPGARWSDLTSGEVAVNPRTVAPWTQGEIAALQIGFQYIGGTYHVTQIYVQVSWTPAP
ncbi:hypothetical protein ES703_22485 [subsurface metagenome]